ncbi:diguanylate cyclase regulator RdcB family protein, partial [Escherichia coli]
KQPVCWSVTQRWQTVALGMPRLCSARRPQKGSGNCRMQSL